MASLLPQQRLLLELLVMSGEIAIPAAMNDSILSRTIEECLRRSWIARRAVGGGFSKIDVTPLGRAALSQAQDA